MGLEIRSGQNRLMMWSAFCSRALCGREQQQSRTDSWAVWNGLFVGRALLCAQTKRCCDTGTGLHLQTAIVDYVKRHDMLV